MIGIVYKYEDPYGKIYIGQTINECHRRGLFFLSKHYGGYKIDKGRKEIGPQNFSYERLYMKEYSTSKEAKNDLDKLEAFYIEKYNSIKEGYNSYKGIRLIKNESRINNRIYKENGLSPIKYVNAEEGKRYAFKSVSQFDLEGNFIQSFKSLSDASRQTQINLSGISRCCQGKLKRVRNYIFKYE